MVVMLHPVACKCASRVGVNCLNFAAAALPSTIKHQVVSSMGPAVMLCLKLAGNKTRIAFNRALDSSDKCKSFAKLGDSLTASSSVNGVLRRFIKENLRTHLNAFDYHGCLAS